MGLYPILADIGYFQKSELDKYGTFDGRLRIFGNIDIPGIDATTGSLGHGIGIACGYCTAAKHDGKDSRTYVILSEGEMYEGSVWESAMFAAHNNLDNLIVVIDRNRKIILGDTEDVLRLEPIREKWESFGWNASVVDGHSYEDLLSAFSVKPGKPSVIIANTVKGKGLSFMEGRPEWHYTKLTEGLIKKARLELA
jgi:transketolase